MNIKAVIIIIFFVSSHLILAKPHKKLVLIPGGQQTLITGRTIGDYYESGLTVAFCNALAQSIEKLSKKENLAYTVHIVKPSASCKVNSREFIEQINIQQADLVIHIGLYAQPEETPSVHFFLLW